MDRLDLSVVVLAYNEVDNLRPSVSELLSALDALDLEFELIIVNDGSTDGTAQVAETISTESRRVRVVHHHMNLGLGAGYRTGFSISRGTYLTFFPADGQFPADIIGTFLPRMCARDLVLGYLPSRNDSWMAKGLSATERLLYTALFGQLPRFQGVFMVRREMLSALPLRSTGRGWAILMEFIIHATRAGWRIESVPTPIRARAAGRSKVNNVRSIASNLVQLLRLRRHL